MIKNDINTRENSINTLNNYGKANLRVSNITAICEFSSKYFIKANHAQKHPIPTIQSIFNIFLSKSEL